VDFDLEKLNEIPDPYESVAASCPPPKLAAGGPTHGRLERRRRGLVLLVCGALGAWIVRVGVAPRPLMPAWFVALALVLPTVVAVLAYLGATRPGRLGLGWPVRSLAAALAAAIVLFAVSALAAPAPALRLFTLQSTLACALTATVLGALPFAAGFFVFRRTLAGSAWLRMTLFGVGCGLVGAVLVRLHCPNDSIPHVLVGHGAALLAYGLLGARVGRGSVRV
jgi:hypothetical protein